MEKTELKDFNEMQWEQFVRKALQQFQFDEALIPGSRFSEVWKLAIASWLKRHSSVSNAWLIKEMDVCHG